MILHLQTKKSMNFGGNHMQELDIKRGHYSNIEGEQLKDLMVEVFGDVSEIEDGKLSSTFGAMAPITAWIKDKKILCVEIYTNRDVDESTAMESIKAKNKFLEAATGYNSKERLKRLKDRAKKGKI
jgi:hypothetical protein